ncbi:MAG: hypothetical protein IPG81_01580 [Sandaracinaceae bacterium]|nr:hypothetical protein [Sandaracinaceae bacterium]
MLHMAPAATGGWLGTPAVHTSLVHWLLSTGMSLFSATLRTAPRPSHSFT